MIPSSALERDDAALYPSGLIAILLHVVLLLFYWPHLVPSASVPGPTHVFKVRLTQFSSVEAFRAFARERVFNDGDGEAAATIGSIAVPSTLLPRPPDSLRAPGTLRPGEPTPPLPDRIFHGGATLTHAASYLEVPEAPRPAFSSPHAPSAADLPTVGARAGLQAPAGPEGRFGAGARPGLSAEAVRLEAAEAFEAPGPPAPFPASRTPPVTFPSALEGAAEPTSLPPQGAGLQPVAPARSAGPVNVGDEIRQAEVDAGRVPDVTSRARRIIRRVAPKYPAWAREQRLEPDVHFFVLVAPEGHVLRVLYKKRSGYPELDSLAADAMRQWLYEAVSGPAEWRVQPIEFRLNGNG